MARKKNTTVFGAIAVWDAAMTLMAHIHPHCELRTGDGPDAAPLGVLPHYTAAAMMVAVAESAAEKVLPISPTVEELCRWAERWELSLKLAAKEMDFPPEGGATIGMLNAAVQFREEMREALEVLFSRRPYRRALTSLAQSFDAGLKLNADQVAELVDAHLPDRKRIDRDICAIYEQLSD